MPTEHALTAPSPAGAPKPALRPGERLTQPEFHDRYERMPGDTKYELIGGMVYMASPMRVDHGDHHLSVGCVLGVYSASTPGARPNDNSTVILGSDSEPQPDLSLRILPEYGGNTRLNARRYLVGAPEWLGEISDSTESIDLNEKRRDYEKYGVLEYVVVCVAQRQLRAFDLATGRELELPADRIFRSQVFPGLWIDEQALFDADLPRLLATLNRGLATPEHAAFAQLLQQRKG